MLFHARARLTPVEAGLTSPIHLRWCNGDLNLKDHPEYAGPFFRYMANAQAFICPTFKTLAVRNSDDHFFAADTAKLKNYKPWYNYTMNAYLGSENSGVKKRAVKKITEVKRPSTIYSFVEESSLVDTAYNVSGLNDSFMVPGDDTMIQGWFAKVGPTSSACDPRSRRRRAVLGRHRRLSQCACQ